MPDDPTVLDHLLDGRDALLREVQRLTDAIEQLDSVLGRLGSPNRAATNGSMPTADSQDAAPDAQPVNPAPEATDGPSAPAAPAGRPAPVAKAAPRRAPARKRTSASRQGTQPKSIRVHVLEMLGQENREFGLAEIIDRVHDAGIQAHDDAVRSITIKLMKDGRVERVGRGQYRLARRGTAAARVATPTSSMVTESAPEPDSAPSGVGTDTLLRETDVDASPAGQDLASADDRDADPQDPTSADADGAVGPHDEVQASGSDERATDGADQQNSEQHTSEQHESEQHESEQNSEQHYLDQQDADHYEPAQHDSEQHDSEQHDAPQYGSGADESGSEESGSDYSPPLNLGQPWEQRY